MAGCDKTSLHPAFFVCCFALCLYGKMLYLALTKKRLTHEIVPDFL